ncbi:MAG: hypothetical protein AB8B47_14280 [Roseobacter sp.]
MITAADIQGHWERDWIKAPNFEDHTTRVHWAQAGMEYADVRIPVERPNLSGVRCLGDLSTAALLQLAQAEGFAGHVTLEETVCTWHREINWHGVPDAPDVGEISFDDQGRMIENGVHAEYAELWEQRADGPPRVQRFAGQGYAGLLVETGTRIVIGIGRADKPATAPLIEQLASGKMPRGIEMLFDGVHAFGHWEGQKMITDLSTQPFSEGRPLVTLSADVVHWHRIDFVGGASDIVMPIKTSVFKT